jgi:hypothetical protein
VALPNPIYVDEQALHTAQAIRLLAYGAVDGQQGVMATGHLTVQALPTPAGAIQVLPGGYSVLAKHLGGDFEAYVGKTSVAEQVNVSPVGSSGSRTDLVILRIENPYVSGAGSWTIPVDPVAGPYAHIRVIEGVPANTQDIIGYNNTWSAITLARITRPANTGIVQQSHITDLRSLADLRGQRITIINNPPPTPPPVAYPLWTGVVECHANSTHLKTQTTFHDWPSEVNFSVPIPAWATTADMFVAVNPEIDGNVYGDLRMTLDGNPVDAPPVIYNYNYARTVGPEQYTTIVAGNITIPSSVAGKTVPLRMQARSLANDAAHPGKFSTHSGCVVTAQLNFKRAPS